MDCSMYPWNWAESVQNAQLSPSPMRATPERSNSAGSEPESCGEGFSVFKDLSRRGRPRADAISTLQVQGSISPSSIRCNICNRVFPREKSLQAHMRTHTGERPYVCDFPSCNKAFCQSGQLKTHQRLHTGEKPFICSYPGCTSRFTHANRHCSEHPYAMLCRMETPSTAIPPITTSEQCDKVADWLAKQASSKQETTPSKFKTKKFKRELEEVANSQHLEARKKAKDAAKQKLSEQRDKLISAIALIELAQGVA